MDAPRKLLADTVARRPDLDLKKLSLSIGRNHAYLQQFLMRGSPRELPEMARHALGPLLGIAPDDLRSYAPPSTGGVRIEADMRMASPQRAPDRADLPVYASSESAAGALAITSEPIVFVRRPEPLVAVRDGYGCYMVGDSMSPAYEQGDLLLIHPGKPVRPGDDCVFVREHGEGTADAGNRHGTQHAQVRRLLRNTPKKFRVRQFNPARDFDIDRNQWIKVHLIVGKYSR